MTGGEDFLRESSQWLGQGDIFSSAPVLDVAEGAPNLVAEFRTGPAMLVTHDCAMDKATNAGAMTVERLAFVRLRSVDALPKQRADLLRSRAHERQPYEAQYLGHVPTLGEMYVLVSDPYFVPIHHFGGLLREFDGPDRDGDRVNFLVATTNDSRVASLADTHLELFRDKWNIQWTRRMPADT